ncbi:MAG: alpha/beta hydrolase [Lacunisphaera sp.]
MKRLRLFRASGRNNEVVLKYLLLPTAFLLAAIASLTVFRAPDTMWAWKLAILAGEFGYWLVLLVVAVAFVAGAVLSGLPRTIILGLSVVATIGFLRPVFSARRLAADLPQNLRQAFGAQISPVPAFSVKELYAGLTVAPARMTTEVYAHPDGNDLSVDFYRPALAKDNVSPPRPCIVVIHGGGWDNGDRTQLASWNPRFVADGYVVAAIDYRLAPKFIWPAQRDDVLAAISWLKTNAVRLGLDPTRFVLLGRSAGGQLATAVGYGAHDPAIRGVIALYAPHDMPFAWSVSREDDALNSIKLFRQYFGGAPDTPERRALYEAASGQLLARTDSPPTLLIHGVPDTLAWSRHSERLALRLQELGVPHYYLKLPWATHGFDFNPHGPGGQLAGYAIETFLSAVLAPDRPSARL